MRIRNLLGQGKHLPSGIYLILVSVLFLPTFGGSAAAQEQTPSGLPVRRIIATTRLMPAPAQEQTPSGLPGQAGTVPGGAPGVTGSGNGNLRFVELRETSNLTRVTGEARDRSFLTGGQNNAVDLSYLENFGLGTRRIEASSVLRYTDDRRVDPEHSSVQRAYFRITGPHSEYNLGDYLVSYSRLTYNQNVKGLHVLV